MKPIPILVAGFAALSLAGCADLMRDLGFGDDERQPARAQTQTERAPAPQAAAQPAQEAAPRIAVDEQLLRKVQRELQAKGVEPGPIDGIWGPKTASAIEKFQQAQGLKATGHLDARTLKALGIVGESQQASAEQQGASAGGGTGQRYDRMFERVDRNNDGAISREEFNATIGAKPSVPARAEGKPTFQNLDANDDGFVTLAEAGADTRISRQFNQADKNNDGRLDKSEFQAALEMTTASAGAGKSMVMSKETIMEVQRKLNAKGFDAGAVNGMLSSTTRRALENFQQAQGMKATGELNSQTLAALDIQTK